jgi:hypothetical protein
MLNHPKNLIVSKFVDLGGSISIEIPQNGWIMDHGTSIGSWNIHGTSYEN